MFQKSQERFWLFSDNFDDAGSSTDAGQIVFAHRPDSVRAKADVFVELFRNRRNLARANEKLQSEFAKRKRPETSVASGAAERRLVW
jgi:hypothetical protein